MRGTKISAHTSMMNSVTWLDEESQTVRLCCGFSDEGRMNGNMDAPTLAMMPAMPRPLDSRASHSRRSHRPSAASSGDRKSTRLNSSHLVISYAVFCLKKKKKSSHVFFISFEDMYKLKLHQYRSTVAATPTLSRSMPQAL